MSRLRHRTFWLAAGLLTLAAATRAQDVAGAYEAGRRAFESGRVEQALALLSSVAAADGDYLDVQVLLGQACLASGLHLDAKRHFERALGQDPANAHAAFLLGLALHESARYFEAAGALLRAHELAPENPHPLIYRGLALLRLGRPDEARGELQIALGLAGEDPTARLALAELELGEGNVDLAEGEVRQVLAVAPLGRSPQGLEATVLLGRIVSASGRPREAVALFERVLQVAPSRSDVLYLLAQAQLRSGEQDAGRATLERFRQLKKLEEEVKLLEARLKGEGGDLEARLRLAGLLLEHGQAGRAAPHVAILLAREGDEPRVRELASRLQVLE